MKKICLICITITMFAVGAIYYAFRKIKVETVYAYKVENILEIYAINYKTTEKEIIKIKYFKPTIENIVELYTIDSNKLPQGYYTGLCANATLISYKDEDIITIIFDRYIVYSYNIDLGFECLSMTLEKIFNKNVEISYI